MILSEKRVLTYGLFDVFDTGHVQFLRQIAQLGDRVLLGLARNTASATATFDERRALLEASRYVDRVIPLAHIDQVRSDIVNHDIAVLALGQAMTGQFDHLRDLVQVVYVQGGPQLGDQATFAESLPAVG